MINIGNLEVSSISLGDTEVTNVYLGNYEIYSSSDWRFVALDSNLEECSETGNPIYCYGVSAYKGTDSIIELPDEYKELPVKKVMGGAFAHNDSLTELTIPSSYEELGEMAFYYCDALDTVSFSDNITSLGSQCFQGCSSLETIVLPTNLETIGSSCFSGCPINSLTGGTNVTSIGSMAFYSASLTDVTNFPNLESIGDRAFGYKTLESFLFGASISSITRPFYQEEDSTNMSYLQKNVYYDGTIEDWCNVTFGSGLCNVMNTFDKFYIKDENGSVEYNGNNYSLLENLVIPSGVTAISSDAFANMNQLRSVTLPSGLLTIGANAFLRCTNLIKIKIPSTVTSIGNQAFRHCTKLCEVCNLSSLQIRRTYGDDLNTVNKYGGCVGGYCHYLTTDSSYTTTIVEVGDFVFQLAPTNFALFVGYRGHNKDVVVPGSFTYNGTTYDTNLTIGTGAFHNNYEVESITFPNAFTQVTWDCEDNHNFDVFFGCSNLKKLVMPMAGRVKYTSRGSKQYPFNCNFSSNPYEYFYNCTSSNQTYSYSTSKTETNSSLLVKSLEEVQITDITYLQYGALQYMTYLKKLSLPDNLVTIEQYAISNCYNLEQVVIGASLTTVGNYALNMCSKLATIFYKGNSTQWSNISIGTYNTPLSNATVYYYSETQPSESGNYWHYVSGEPTIWS